MRNSGPESWAVQLPHLCQHAGTLMNNLLAVIKHWADITTLTVAYKSEQIGNARHRGHVAKRTSLYFFAGDAVQICVSTQLLILLK